MKSRLNQSGDTLVEVLFATVIISIILAGAFSLSSRALRFNQTATERTEVVNKIREQIEVLSYIRENKNSFPAVWNDILNNHVDAVGGTKPFYFELFNSPGDPSSGLADPAIVADYVVAYNNADIDNLTTVKDSYNVDSDIFNIRVIPTANSDYIDFTVQANWNGIGDLGPQSAGAVLRLAR